MLKGTLALLLLQLLSMKEDYGYAIVLRLQEHGFSDLSEGTVYPALTRLESQGLLAARLVRSTSGPARKYYRPTEAGLTELNRAGHMWHRLVTAVARIVPAPESPSPENSSPENPVPEIQHPGTRLLRPRS
jgi:PadR family transcriptional regulator PadR